MSAGGVRSQLQTFLQGGNIAGLSKVYLSEPLYAPASDWNLAAEGGWAAIAWPWISDESEERITLGAPNPATGQTVSGQKAVTYKVSILLLFRYRFPAQMSSEDAWQVPLDTLIEGVKARLRSDPTAGGNGPIFQQSQEPGDLQVMRDPPRRDTGKIDVWQRVDTTVKEIISA